MVAAVAHEVTQEAGSHLARCQGQSRNGNREDRSGHSDRGRSYGTEKGACAFGATGIPPGRCIDVCPAERFCALDPHPCLRRDDADYDDDRRAEPELVAHRFKPCFDAAPHKFLQNAARAKSVYPVKWLFRKTDSRTIDGPTAPGLSR